MKIVSTENKDQHLIATVESDASLFDKNYLKFFNIEQQKINIKGFRKGKVPVDLANKYINHKIVNEKTLNAVVHDTINLLKKSEQLHEYEVFDDVVKNEIIDFKADQKIVVFKSYFETKPIVQLGDYSNIETIFEPKLLKKIYWPVAATEISDKSVIYVKLFAYDKDKKKVFKYCFEVLEIDLEHTNINPDLLSELKKLKIKKPHVFELSVGDDTLFFNSELLTIFNKTEINQKLFDEIENKGEEIKTVKDLKNAQQKHFEKQNDEFLKNIVVQWTGSEFNTISHAPTHNLGIESRKIFDNYMKTNGHMVPNDEKIHQRIFENIFYDNLSKIKIACVLEQIIKNENITVEDGDVDRWTKTISENPQMYKHIDLNSSYNKDNLLVKSIAQQEKCINLIKKNIIFSS